MSLLKLLTSQKMDYYAPDGQDKITGAMKYKDPQEIRGRLGEGVVRFDSQESIDSVADASLTSLHVLIKSGKIVYEGQNYVITERFAIRLGDSKIISHYNYKLKSYEG